MNVCLIGFKACGKSTVGAMLADHLDLSCTDLDREIETLYQGLTGRHAHFRAIYKRHGESYFRDLESRALEAVAERRDVVLATGGGAPLRERNRLALRRFGTVCYLQVSPGRVFQRLQRKGMPAWLAEHPTFAALLPIWQQRHGIYLSLADIVVNTDLLTAAQVAEHLAARLEDRS